MPKQTPLILRGPLTGKWYVVTKYKQEGDIIHALEKFDVTDRILEIITEALQNQRKERAG